MRAVVLQLWACYHRTVASARTAHVQVLVRLERASSQGGWDVSDEGGCSVCSLEWLHSPTQRTSTFWERSKLKARLLQASHCWARNPLGEGVCRAIDRVWAKCHRRCSTEPCGGERNGCSTQVQLTVVRTASNGKVHLAQYLATKYHLYPSPGKARKARTGRSLQPLGHSALLVLRSKVSSAYRYLRYKCLGKVLRTIQYTAAYNARGLQ